MTDSSRFSAEARSAPQVGEALVAVIPRPRGAPSVVRRISTTCLRAAKSGRTTVVFDQHH